MVKVGDRDFKFELKSVGNVDLCSQWAEAWLLYDEAQRTCVTMLSVMVFLGYYHDVGSRRNLMAAARLSRPRQLPAVPTPELETL